MSSPTFLGDYNDQKKNEKRKVGKKLSENDLTRPRGPILGASEAVAPISPPIALMYTAEKHNKPLKILSKRPKVQELREISGEPTGTLENRCPVNNACNELTDHDLIGIEFWRHDGGFYGDRG
jgi:hypothetical protein